MLQGKQWVGVGVDGGGRGWGAGFFFKQLMLSCTTVWWETLREKTFTDFIVYELPMKPRNFFFWGVRHTHPTLKCLLPTDL